LENNLYTLEQCKNCIGLIPVARIIRRGTEAGERFRNQNPDYPAKIQIEPVSACNYECDGCQGGDKTRPVHRIQFDRIFENIRSALPYVQELIPFNNGEPLLHEGLCGFIAKCREAAPEIVITLSTNGMLLDEETAECFVANRVNAIIVSVHGGPGTENLRKYSVHGDYDKVLSNVKRLLEIRRTKKAEYPKVILRAVLFNWNDSDELMERFRADARALGLGTSYHGDRYEWRLDYEGVDHPRSSKRFYSGSEDTKILVKNSEISLDQLVEELTK
jgi:MoaA/NifB/PqqE/SkfB family radical SAM enzyme